MSKPADTNANIWQSEQIVQHWAAEAARRERDHAAQWRFMAELLPFGQQESFTFLDLGAGTGNLARAVLSAYPTSTAILADFSAGMMGAGEQQMLSFAGRYEYVEFDMSGSDWPEVIPASISAVVTSLCVHHLPDERKQGLFAEIFSRLLPGGWYLNYDPVRAEDPVVGAVWERVNDHRDPELKRRRTHPTHDEQARYENHVRYIIPLAQQLEYLREAGYTGIDVYYKQLDYVVYGGCRPG